MKHLIITILFLIASTALASQEAASEKKRRWQFSSSLGLDTYPVYGNNNGQKGSKLFLMELGYRFHRHLDVSLQVGHQQENWSGFSKLETLFVESGSIQTSWNSRRLNFFIGLQGKANFRVGQGDLSLSGTFGLSRSTNLVRARSPLPFSAEIRMAPLRDVYNNIHLAYTYWATEKFGLVTGFSILTINSRGLSRNVDYTSGNVPRYVIADWAVEGLGEMETDLNPFRDFVRLGARHYFTMGLTARIF